MICAVLFLSSVLAPSTLPPTALASGWQDSQAGADAPVASTGDEVLTRADFGLWLVDRAGLDNVTDYVVEVLAAREATERGLLPTDADVHSAFEAEFNVIVREYYHGDPAAYARDIELREQDPDKHAERRRRQIRADLTLAALAQADRQVTDEQIARRFKDLFGPLAERTSLDVLFFDMYREIKQGERPNIPALKDEALGRAEAAVAALRNGKPFAEVREGSDPVNSDFITPEGHIETYSRRLLGKEVETAVASLDEPGDVSPPIAVFDGYYVVRIAGRQPVDQEAMKDVVTADIQQSPADSGEVAVVRARLLEQDGVEIILR